MDSQCTMILNFMRTHGSITSRQALQKPMKCARLASRISDLKKAGYAIRSDRESYIDEDGKTIRYAVYSLEEGF